MNSQLQIYFSSFEHLIYTTWVEARLFDLFDKKSSNPNHCSAVVAGGTENQTNRPAEEEVEIMAMGAEKTTTPICSNTSLEQFKILLQFSQ